MFDAEGGVHNVAIAFLNIVSIMVLVFLPVMFSMPGTGKFGMKQVIIGLIGLSIYCFLFYVANPSLTFWIVK